MKRDKLEQFIHEHREEFDDLEPDHESWEDIDIPDSKVRTINFTLKTFLSRAAAVVIIFIASYYFHEFRSQKTIEKGKNTAENNPVYEELMEAEFYYSAQISERKEELFKLIDNVPGLQKDVSNELDDLDAIYLELKQDLKDNVDSQEVIEAMMQNFRLKLEILENMLEQIKSKKNKNKPNDEELYS